MDTFPPPKRVVIGSVALQGTLDLPPEAKALIVFAHGSGSTRSSPRNLQVAQVLHASGFGTLLFDLLTPYEARDRSKVFDVPLLGSRVVETLDWADRRPVLAVLPVGLFGASTGAAAALVAAASRPQRVFAVVSRGGRPDLADAALTQVHVPTLLIVGGADQEVLALNRNARARMHSRCELAVVPGATHLFEEEGALERVAELAADWFSAYVPKAPVNAKGK